MRILTGSATLAAVLLIGLAGSAAAAEATGVIKSLNTGKDLVVLDNGKSFNVAKDVKLSTFKVGEKVTITYTQTGAMMDATAIKPAA